MRRHWFLFPVVTIMLLLLGSVEASAQGDRIYGVRKDAASRVVLFSIETLTGLERTIATLQTADADIQLLGITALNARRGSFSYVYTDRRAAKDYLHTVSLLNGQTLSRIALPSDISGLEVMTDTGAPVDSKTETDTLRRRIQALEQDVRRLQTQVRAR